MGQTMKVEVWRADGTTESAVVIQPDVGRILKGCRAFRCRNPGRLAGQTEKLCLLLLDEHDKRMRLEKELVYAERLLERLEDPTRPPGVAEDMVKRWLFQLRSARRAG